MFKKKLFKHQKSTSNMRKLVALMLGVIVLLVLSISIILVKNKTLSPEQNILEGCKTLKYNGKDKINIVFFSTKEQAEKYSDFLLKIPPFDKNQEIFNFFYLNNYEPECEIYKGIALLCYSKEMIKKAGSCPNDYVVVIKDEKSSIRSSSYMNVLSINPRHQLTVFPHEFGHAFVNLADEYVPATLPSKSKNCVSDCEKFGGEKEGCFAGCSKSEYFRSIDSGIMRTLLSEDYGKINKNIILEKLSKNAKISGQVIEEIKDCSAQQYHLIEGMYNDGTITITDKFLEAGCVGENGAGDFNYNLIMQDNTKFLEGEFNPELIFTDAQKNSEIDGEVLKSERSFLLKLPIIENSKSLEIIKDDKKLVEISLEDIGARPCKK